MTDIKTFESSMEEFHKAVLDRLKRALQMSGKPMEVDLTETAYVVPGYSYELTADNQDVFRLWVGANYQRLFFISRLKASVSVAEEMFKFTFGGAQAVGWTINYEKIGDEVSIWATKMVPAPLVTPGSPNFRPRSAEITQEGSFWAVDIAMMVQSMVRTAQRNGIKPSDEAPEPL